MNRSLLIFLLFFLFLPKMSVGAQDINEVKVSLQIPVGFEGGTAEVSPNSTVSGEIMVELLSRHEISGRIVVTVTNGTLLSPPSYRFTLKVRRDLRAFPIKISVGRSPCLVVVRCESFGSIVEKREVLIPKGSWDIDLDLRIPTDTLGRTDPRTEPNTVIVRSSLTPTFVRMITGEGRSSAHPDLLTMACVKVEGQGVYTLIVLIEDEKGETLPISTSSLEAKEAKSDHGVITLENVIGGEKNIFPIFTPISPERLAGSYRMKVLVYPAGSSKPVLVKTFPLRIISTKGSVLILSMFAGGVALPVFLIVTSYYLRRRSMGDVLLCSLMGCLIFSIVFVPGQLVWGIASVLGPFDWLITGLVYDVFLYMLYVVAVSLRPRFGTLTMVMFSKWIMYSFFFGRLSIISVFWLATSSLFFEPLLYLAGVTSRGVITRPRILVSFVPAAVVDKYVDLILYAALYRLYYAGWYVAMYSLGNALYTIPGLLAGIWLSTYVRGVAHE